MTLPSNERSSPFSTLIPAILVATLLATIARAERDPIRDDLSVGMAGFVSGLDTEQRDEAMYDFDDDERFDLRLAPLWLEGLRIDQMSDSQWKTLEGLLGGVLSAEGLAKMNTIRSLEREVAALEDGLFGFFFDRMRDTRRYFLTVFGTPGDDGPWAMRFDGHHLSLNWTAIPDAPLSATPLFFGGQPRIVPTDLERAGLRVLRDEEELAVAFLNALSEEERTRARVPLEEGSAIRRPMSILGDVDLELPAPAGLLRSSLDPDGRARFDALVEVHLANFETSIADRYRAQILGPAGSATLLFASADEPTASGRSLYYRIQGGGFVIEFDDTSLAADHIHVVLRNPANDFGRDVLDEHLASHHAAP